MTLIDEYAAREAVMEAFWPVLGNDERWLCLAGLNDYAGRARRVLTLLLFDECGLSIEQAAKLMGGRAHKNVRQFLDDARADIQIQATTKGIAALLRERGNIKQGGPHAGRDANGGREDGDRGPQEAAGDGDGREREGRKSAARLRLSARG